MTIKLSLAEICAAAGDLEHAFEFRRHNARLAVAYITSMQEMTLPSGGVLGGVDAFRYTSTGAGSLKSKELRESWFARVNWPLTSYCEKCGCEQRNAIGHLFPRVFGGAWNKLTGHHHSIPECTVCNSNKGQQVDPRDEEFLSEKNITIEGWR